MSIVRAIVLKNASVTGVCSSSARDVTGSTGWDVGQVLLGKTLYAGLHTLSSSTGNAILVKLLSASSSAMGALNPGTVQVTFTCYSCRAAQWATPIAGPLSSDHRYWKLQWETTTTGRNFLGWISIVGDSAA